MSKKSRAATITSPAFPGREAEITAFNPKPDSDTLEGRLVAVEEDVRRIRAHLEKAGQIPPL